METVETDVLIIGGRCAGTALGAALANKGVRVLIVDRSTFPSDRISTHILQLNGASDLAKLGLTDQLLATGAPALTGMDVKIDGVDVSCDFRLSSGDGPGAFCIRRRLLDELLLENARRCGAVIWTETAAVDLLRDRGRIAGAHVRRSNGEICAVRGSIVVGADGESSFVARKVDSKKYHVTPGERFVMWTYVSGHCSAPRIAFSRDGESIFITVPVDRGDIMVLANPPLDRLAQARNSPAEFFRAELARAAHLDWASEAVDESCEIHVVGRSDSYFREAAGPGWALVGDSGRFKDPCTGQGMSDAFRHANALAISIDKGFRKGDLDKHLSHWWRWRDRDDASFAAFMNYQGRAARASEFEKSIMAMLSRTESGKSDLSDIFAHRRTPARVLSPMVMGRAWLKTAQKIGPRRVTQELIDLGLEEARWRWRLNLPSRIQRSSAWKQQSASYVDV